MFIFFMFGGKYKMKESNLYVLDSFFKSLR